MELRHLRYFTAVAEESTVIAAAKRLGVAQPALTRQIHALERELDVELFERGPRGVALTPAGEVMLASARHVLRQVGLAVERARGSSDGIAGRCVICTGPRALASGVIARIIVRLNAQFPDIDVGVTEGTMGGQFRALRTGEADIGLGVSAPAEFPDLASEVIDFDVMDAIAIAETHPLANRASVAITELAHDTFIGWGADTVESTRTLIRTAFAEIGFTPVVREYNQLFALAAAVVAGQGWTLIPTEATALAPHGTRVVPLSNFKVPLPHAIVWRSGERRPVVRTVIDVIRRVVTDERRVRNGLPSRRHTPLQPTTAVPDASRVAPAALLELRHLRYFCAVVETGSFGRAAEQLGLTQPALSRQVGDLERVVGVPVLERAARGTSTTPAGESLHRSARHILDEVGAIAAEAQRARRGDIARCLIATVPTTSARNLLAAVMREYGENTPYVELAFEELATPRQPAALRDGHIDLGVCHASPLSAVEERGVARMHLTADLVNCALVAASSELAVRSELSLRDLADVPFLFPDRDFQPAMYDQLFAVFERHAFNPRVDATYDGLQTIWALIAQDRGWGIGFASQCAAPPPGTVSVPLDGFSLPWGLDLLSRDDESRSLILDVADRIRDLATTIPAMSPPAMGAARS